MKQIDIYTDGSYNKDFPGFTYGAFVSNVASVSAKTSVEEATSMWNVGGELLAAIAAITFAKEVAHNLANSGESLYVNLYYDYEGVGKWASGDWKAKKPLTKAYRKFYLETVSSVQNMTISLNWVKGHSNVQGNIDADALAKSGLDGNEECLNMDDLINKVLGRE